jgi:hypothetical protein
MTLKAPPSAGRHLQAKKNAGEHLDAVQPPARSKEEIKRRAREFADFRRQQAAEQALTPVYPTPERMAKEAHGMASSTIPQGRGAAPLRAYRTKPPVEQYRGQWGDHVEIAFAMFIKDAAVLDGVRMTIDYDSTGGGVPGRRVGGLGSAADYQRDQLERYLWVRERMPAKFQRVADWLLIEVRSEISGRTVSWGDAGRMLFPSIRDKATSKGISIGALLMTGELMASLYRKYAILSNAEAGEMKPPPYRIIRGE